MDAAGYQVVPRTLGRRLREDWRLDLEIALLQEMLSRRLQQPVPEDEVLPELRPSKVEISVAQAELFGRKFFVLPARDRNGGRLRWSDDAYRRRDHLHVAGFHLRIPHRLRPSSDLSLDENDGLVAEPAGRSDGFRRRPIRIE